MGRGDLPLRLLDRARPPGWAATRLGRRPARRSPHLGRSRRDYPACGSRRSPNRTRPPGGLSSGWRPPRSRPNLCWPAGGPCLARVRCSPLGRGGRPAQARGSPLTVCRLASSPFPPAVLHIHRRAARRRSLSRPQTLREGWGLYPRPLSLLYSPECVEWGLCEVRTIPQASVTLPCLPGLSFAGLREEQESERFRVVRTRSRCRTRTNAGSGSVDARFVENERPRKGVAEDLKVRLLGARFCRSLSRSKVAGTVSREEEGERRAFARRALRPYLAAVGLGDLAGYGKPQARAARGAGGIGPVEALVDEGQLILGDPNPRIRDRQRHAAVFLPHTGRDAPTLRRELDRVLKENGSHLHYPLPIEDGCSFVLV